VKDEEFAAGVDAILLSGVTGHTAHRALDLWWTRYATELGEGHPVAIATRKWMVHIEGDHDGGRYPLGRRWWQVWFLRPRTPKPSTDPSEYGSWTCP